MRTLAQFVHPGAIDGTLNLDPVRITIEHPPDGNGIPVHQGESPITDAVHVEQFVLPPHSAHHANLAPVGVAREPAGIGQQLRQRLAGLHLVAHRTFDAPRDLHQKIVRGDQHDIALFQADVVFRIPVEKVFVDVHGRDLTPAAKHPDIAQGADVRDTPGLVKGMEHRGERRQPVGARHLDLAHHVHLDRAKAPQRNAHLRSGAVARNSRVDLAENAPQLRVRLLDRKPVQIDRTHLLDHDISLRGDLLPKAPLVLAPDVDNDLVAGAQPVIFRRGLILVRLESQSPAPEHVATENSAGIRTPFGRVRNRRNLDSKRIGRRTGPLPALARDDLIRSNGLGGCPAILVFLLQALNLLRRDAARQQLLADLLIALAGLPALQSVLDNRFVAHLTISGPKRSGQQKSQ